MNIRQSTACPQGITLLVDLCDAWAAHDHARVRELERAEREHLARCPQCRGEAAGEDLVQQLWPGCASAKEEET